MESLAAVAREDNFARVEAPSHHQAGQCPYGQDHPSHRLVKLHSGQGEGMPGRMSEQGGGHSFEFL